MLNTYFRLTHYMFSVFEREITTVNSSFATAVQRPTWKHEVGVKWCIMWLTRYLGQRSCLKIRVCECLVLFMDMYVSAHTYTGFHRIKCPITTWRSVAMALHFLKLPSILLTPVFTQKGMNIQPWYSYFSRVKNHPSYSLLLVPDLICILTLHINLKFSI